MQFRVNLPLSSRDTTYDPASGGPLRGGRNQEPIIVRLANPSSGQLAPGVKPSITRQLILFEAEGPAGQPLEDLINNTKWRGIRDRAGHPPDTPVPGSQPDQFGQGIWMTELPRVGSTEVWEFLNLTVDAHPIHIHLNPFQVLARHPITVTVPEGGISDRATVETRIGCQFRFSTSVGRSSTAATIKPPTLPRTRRSRFVLCNSPSGCLGGVEPLSSIFTGSHAYRYTTDTIGAKTGDRSQERANKRSIGSILSPDS